MAESLSDQIERHFAHIAENYYRLLLVVGPSGTGKSGSLRDVHLRTGVPLINVNLELSRRLLDLTVRQRALQLPTVLEKVVASADSSSILLDNIEVLFDVALKQDPLRLLQHISRNKAIVVAWNGFVTGDQITYAVPGHPEYRRYPVRDFLFVNTEPSSQRQGGSDQPVAEATT